jgi:SAM-dependent methyltransferase
MEEPLRINRDRWDELVGVHLRSRFYDLPGFRAGRCSLRPLELAALGNVSGQSLLHLQCHFGQDTLSWARRGALVTGVDFSPAAIAAARELAGELALPARFVESNVLTLSEVLEGRFEIVVTTYGVLGWLPDVGQWARVVAHFLAPGGRLFLADTHPAIGMFDGDGTATGVRLAWPYFDSGQPLRGEFEHSYADSTTSLINRAEYWYPHTLGDVVNALISAGLVIDRLDEHRFGICAMLPGSTQGEDGWWYLPPGMVDVPQLYSILASAPSAR